MGGGTKILAAVCAAVAGPLLGATSAPRTHEALVADPGNWVTYGRTYDEQHYSPLTEINDQNIGRLGLAWSMDVDAPSVLTAPLAVDGVIYTSIGYSVIHAIDARTGKLLWKYDPEVWKTAGIKLRAGWGARGIAYKDGKVFTATLEGRLLALDARTGKLLWTAQTLADPNDSRYITGPPWAFNDKVIIGHGGADYGAVRGYVTAYDIKTGKQAWRFYTVPGDPSKGPDGAASDKVMPMAAKTWHGEWWKFGGGGTVWHAMAFDPKFNRVYLGVGNGAPWNHKIRSQGKGDNLFLTSIVALDANTGEYVWHHQMNPGESWDFNNAMDIELAELPVNGRPTPVILHAPKNGFFYVIDRTNGKLISAEKFAEKVNWADRVDIATGRPVERPEARYPDGKAFVVYPSPVGAHGVHAMSYSPKTGLAYIPVTEFGRAYVDPDNIPAWQFPKGIVVTTGHGSPPANLSSDAPTSSLTAWDPVRQRLAWKIPFPGMHQGGTMATAGNVVFQGRGTGEFVAYAADTGKKLWSFDAQVGVQSQPISYVAGGKQYVTVIAGWRASGPNGDGKVWDYRTQPRRILTFALDATGKLPPAPVVDTPILDDPDFKVDAPKAEKGQSIYMATCFICHGGGAVSGGAAPDLRMSAAVLSGETFASVVREGTLRPRGMPHYPEFTDDDLEALRHFVRRQGRVGLKVTSSTRSLH